MSSTLENLAVYNPQQYNNLGQAGDPKCIVHSEECTTLAIFGCDSICNI